MVAVRPEVAHPEGTADAGEDFAQDVAAKLTIEPASPQRDSAAGGTGPRGSVARSPPPPLQGGPAEPSLPRVPRRRAAPRRRSTRGYIPAPRWGEAWTQEAGSARETMRRRRSNPP